MGPIDFPEWQEVLQRSDLPARLRRSFEITVRWYLSFCRRARADVTVQSARDFIDTVRQQKQPQAWQLEEWKDGLRWFFRTAKQRQQPAASSQTPESEAQVWVPPDGANWPEWKVAFLTTLRRRRYSDRTEESYLVWLEQFDRHSGTEDLRAQGEREIAGFLDSLALNKRLSASSQRQALNALVFLYREVFGRPLGDFSDYRRAKARTHLPVWLTKEEVIRIVSLHWLIASLSR